MKRFIQGTFQKPAQYARVRQDTSSSSGLHASQQRFHIKYCGCIISDFLLRPYILPQSLYEDTYGIFLENILHFIIFHSITLIVTDVLKINIFKAGHKRIFVT